MLTPSSKITEIPGIGQSKAELFARLGIVKVKDLVEYYPFRYEDTTKITDIVDLIPSEDKQTVQGTIETIKNFRTRNGKKLTSATVADETGEIEILWFNQHFLVKILKPGRKVLLNGKVDGTSKLKLISPTYEIISDYYDPTHLGRITPVYPETKGLTSKFLRKILKDIDTHVGIKNFVKEKIPTEIVEEEKLLSKDETLKILHFPENMEDVRCARDRMAFEEIYEILEKVQKEKKKQAKYKAPQIKTERKLITHFLENLPFEPTKDQLQSINEILKDLEEEVPMHRLLEGDVGSGKTLVAIAATLNTVSQGYQVAVLAPTQVLAEQHYKTFIKFAPWAKDDILLVTGNTTKFEKRKTCGEQSRTTKNGKSEPRASKSISSSLEPRTSNLATILIGTHAILHQADNLLENLGLVIIDEQHRFGVKQRDFLTEFIKEWGVKTPLIRGEDPTGQGGYRKLPHVLSMTATPIPRSLALTLYGDLEISAIEEMPAGRIPVDTHVVPEEKRSASYDWVRKQVKDGGQAFVICPLVEESEVIDVKSATAEFEKLSKKVFPDLKVELLHGRIKGEEKERILTDFKNQKFDILVSTAVVEVGIDIPNATVIIIEGAERFGLAQLHQFRGRVGRSDKKSYCLLFTNSESEDAVDRLHFFAKTQKGLEIAEYDLKRRGPGEVYGTKQSGIPDLKFANLLDLKLIKRVKKWF